jgi:hypothetical protein
MPWLRRSVGDRSSKRQHFAQRRTTFRFTLLATSKQQIVLRAGTSVAALLRLVCVGRSQAGLLTSRGVRSTAGYTAGGQTKTQVRQEPLVPVIMSCLLVVVSSAYLNDIIWEQAPPKGGPSEARTNHTQETGRGI